MKTVAGLNYGHFFVEIPMPSQECERSCILLGIMVLPLSKILELFRQFGTVLKYHTAGTVLKYHTGGTVLKYHTVGTVLKYHTVGTVLKDSVVF
jgi:hypothetical protein